MTWGYQIGAVIQGAECVTGVGAATWVLPPPIGPVSVRTSSPKGAGFGELTFRGGGLESRRAAERSGEALQRALKVAAALTRVSVDPGPRGQGKDLSWASNAAQKAVSESSVGVEVQLVPDVWGLVTFEVKGEMPLRLMARTAGSIDPGILHRNVEDLLPPLEEWSDVGELSDVQWLACELMMAARAEASIRAELVTLVTALEVLSIRDLRRQRAQQLLDGFAMSISDALSGAEEQDVRELQGLKSALEDLRRASISSSIKQAVRNARAGELGLGRLVDDIYKCRSELVHSGRTTVNIFDLVPLSRKFCEDVLRFQLRQ